MKLEILKKDLFFKKIPVLLFSIFLVILPLQAFLQTWIRFKFSLAVDQILLVVLWKEYLIVILFIIVFFKIYVLKRFPFKILTLDKLILAFSALAFIYFLFFGGNLGQKIAGLRYDLEFFLIYFLARSFKFSIKQIKFLLILFLTTSVFVIIFGLLQISYLPSSFMLKFGYTQNLEEYLRTGIISTYNHVTPNLPNLYRIQSTFPNALQFSSYLVLVISFFLSAVLYIKKKGKFFLAPLLFASFIAIVATYSRSAWLGLFFGLFAVFFFYAKKKIYVIWPMVLAILAVLVFVLLFFNSRAFQALFFHGEIRENVLVGSTQVHKEALIDSIDIICKNPLGVGIGSAGPASRFAKDVIITESSYLQIAIELGIAGLVVFASVIFLLFRNLCAIFKKTSDNFYRILSLGLVGGVVGIGISGLFLHTWTDTISVYSLWFFAGLIISFFEDDLKITYKKGTGDIESLRKSSKIG